MSAFQAVIFDFGKVICNFDIDIFLQRAARRSTMSLRELRALLPAIAPLAVQYETGLVTSQQFFERVTKLAALSMPEKDFVTAYCDIFVPISTTFDLIRELKGHYKLGLLSNTNEWHYLYGIKPVEVFPLFDAVTLSFEVRAMKPATAAYADILRKLNLPPEECVYIDDLAENVAAAQVLGFQACRYTTPQQLRADLAALDILPNSQ